MDKYLSQIPAFQEWQDFTRQVGNWQNFQYHTARVDQMICFADILWPEFIELEGLILRKSGVPDNWDAFKEEAQKAHWSASDIEYIVNHLHIMDLFINDPDRDHIEIEVFNFLAQTIADMWKCRLKDLFPRRTFVVGIADSDIEPEVYAYSEH